MKRTHIIPLLCLCWTITTAQLNLKAGYCLAFVDAPSHAEVIGSHEAAYSEFYTESFKPLDVLHGMDLGLEQRWESFGVEAGWRLKRNRQQGAGNHPSGPFRNKLSYSLGTFYTGLVQYLGPVRLSASIDYNYLRNKVEFELPAEETVIKDDTWGSTFSLGYFLQGSGAISLLIAPYAQIMWTEFDLGPVKSTLTGQPSPAIPEEYFNYGITIHFLNGPR